MLLEGKAKTPHLLKNALLRLEVQVHVQHFLHGNVKLVVRLDVATFEPLCTLGGERITRRPCDQQLHTLARTQLLFSLTNLCIFSERSTGAEDTGLVSSKLLFYGRVEVNKIARIIRFTEIPTVGIGVGSRDHNEADAQSLPVMARQAC